MAVYGGKKLCSAFAPLGSIIIEQAHFQANPVAVSAGVKQQKSPRKTG